MKGTLIMLLNLFLCTTACRAVPRQDSAKNSAEQEIRAALCEIDQHSYAAAQQRVERLLQADSKNVYARKLLLGILARQIKPDDKSPENIALIRAAINAYQEALSNPQLTKEDKVQIDKSLIDFYGRISRDEQQREIEKRAADTNRDAKDRSSLYTMLAGQSWNCSLSITEKLAVAGGNGKLTYKKPAEQKDFEMAQQCVERGFGQVESALKLDPDNESAWSYKTYLLSEASKLAEMEGDLSRKETYRKQSEEAQRVSIKLAEKERAENEKAEAKREQESKKNDSFTPEEGAEFARELVEFKRENSLAEAVQSVFTQPLELTRLVAPNPEQDKERDWIDLSDPTSKGCFPKADRASLVQEKRNWKSFAPEGGDFAVELPDNVCKSGNGYLAASEGVMYSINSIPTPSIPLDQAAIDGTLNTMARTFAGFHSHFWLEGGAGNSFEMKLLRKENPTGQPRKIYAYFEIACNVRTENVLVVQAAKTRYYTMEVIGANESDARTQRFLKSLKVN